MGVSKLVLDAGPIINLSREEIVASGEKLYATPAVIREIRDENARRTLDLLKDEITVQQPSKEAVKFVQEFAKLTGDAIVLSTQDIEVIALAYDLVEDKGSLRQAPNVSQPNTDNAIEHVNQKMESLDVNKDENENKADDDGFTVIKPKRAAKKPVKPKKVEQKPEPVPTQPADDSDSDSDWGEDGWIDPTNLAERTAAANMSVTKVEEDIEVAVSSRDYAVQNTTLQIGIPAINERGLRIKQLKNTMQRCYACFKLVPMAGQPKQFCPQCGQHTLSRVTTSVDRYGKLHVHLKAKMQWITRGDRYTLPTPQSRRARREKHDDKKELYAEDQPEYIKALKKQQWQQRRNEKLVNEYIGPSTVETAVSPFIQNRQQTIKLQIGRGRYANATGKKSHLNLD